MKITRTGNHCALSATLFAAAVLTAGAASANVQISDFGSFDLTGTYENWNDATFTSGASDFRVEGGDFGGGWFELPAPVDATGETSLEIMLDVNAANVATLFNVVIFDADGTERVYRWEELAVGDDQTLTVGLDDFLQDNNAGTVEGLDVSNITQFHLQGSFSNGNPGLLLDLTFDNLALVSGSMGLSADFNGDGSVDLLDLDILGGNWQMNGTAATGDANGDGFVDLLDLDELGSQWQQSASFEAALAATGIPEPGSLALLGLGGLAIMRRRK